MVHTCGFFQVRALDTLQMVRNYLAVTSVKELVQWDHPTACMHRNVIYACDYLYEVGC